MTVQEIMNSIESLPTELSDEDIVDEEDNDEQYEKVTFSYDPDKTGCEQGRVSFSDY